MSLYAVRALTATLQQRSPRIGLSDCLADTFRIQVSACALPSAAFLRCKTAWPRCPAGFADHRIRLVVIRCTGRLLLVLGVKPTELQSFEPAEDDCYANLVWIDRRKGMLLAHASTLFPIFVADVLKHDLIPFGQWAVERISDQLEVEGLNAHSLGRLDAGGAALAKTSSRMVVGHMNDMTRYCEYAVAASGG